jgi:GNAT superfamily N-acetyltransferase
MTVLPIRQASPAERAAVVTTVTAAFIDDPAWRFITHDEYEQLAPHFAGALFDLRAVSGNVWVSDDLATVAMWDGPRRVNEQAQAAERIWADYRAAAGNRAYERLVAYKSAVAAAEPPDSYWYLGVLATDPARRREGLASAVLGPVLRVADHDGIACCLETSTQANRRFYERRGFIEATTVVIQGGPLTWWLRRPPRLVEETSANCAPAI